MIYSALIRRLDQDVSAGDAVFDDITTGTNSFVRTLDAPALYAITTADRVDATLQALLDEYERTDRFGFSAEETEVAKAAAQAGFDSLYDGRNTTQDVDYAEQYVQHFLAATPYPHADTLYEVATATIAAVTPEALDLRFRARWDNTAPHVIISTPEQSADQMPSEAEVLAMIAATPERELSPRDGGRELPDELMVAPEPVEPTSREELLDLDDPFFDPIEIVFPNGARVRLTSNDIVEGQVGFQAASPGGSSLVTDDDVVDALYAADVVTSSGVGEFNQSELEQMLADRDVGLVADITPYVDSLAGGSASSDLETLMQLIHLYMTQPRFDPVALGQLQRSEGPVVSDPASAPDLAGYDALVDHRYPGELRYAVLPTPEQFATLDLEGVERVWRERFGDAGDWVFVFAGDIDVDELVDLAERYIGTLPGDSTVEQWIDVEDPPPAGVVRSTVEAGTGDSSSLSLLFTTPLASVDGATRATNDVVTEVLTTRLTDVIRERLGESYSPTAFSYINSDPDLALETYVSVTGSPDRVESVGDLVVAEIADLATNGPSEREFQGAFAQVEESYGFVNNQTFIQEMLNDAIWPDREMQDYIDQYSALGDVTAETVRAFIAAQIPTTQYIQVAVLPR
jgi:zinc protease